MGSENSIANSSQSASDGSCDRTIVMDNNVRPVVAEDVERTVVMQFPDSGSNSSTSLTGMELSKNKIIGKPLILDDVNLTVDDTDEFIHGLEGCGNRYQREKLIASGGFGHVFLVKDKILGRQAVIKSLRNELLDKPLQVKKFIAEAKLCSQLDHPSIVPLYSLNSDNGGLSIAMQFVNGITLKEFLERARKLQREQHPKQKAYVKSLQERLDIFLRVCDALEYSHARHVIHCDIKPDNIMIGRFGEVYVMDWGIATTDGVNRKGQISGTPAYMPPESLKDGVTNEQTDIFALGMLLNELVTLRYASSGQTKQETITRICDGDFEPSTSVDEAIKIPAALRAIIETARDVDPDVRYKHVKDMADDLRRFMFNEEVKVYPDDLFQAIRRYASHHSVGAMYCIIAVIVILAGFGIVNAVMRGRDALLAERERELALRLETSRNNRRMRQALAEQQDEQLRQVELQSRDAVLASAISGFESACNRIQEQTDAFGFALSLKLGEADSQRNTDDMVGFTNDTYHPNSNSIMQRMVLQSPAFPRPITYDHGVFVSLPTTPRNTICKWSQILKPFTGKMLGDVMANVPRKELDKISQENWATFLYSRDNLLHRVTILLPEGIVYRYPGMYETLSAKNDFLNDGGRRILSDKSITVEWTGIHKNEYGKQVISCWRRLYNREGQAIGAACSDISVENLVSRLNRSRDIQKTPGRVYVLDRRGSIISTFGVGEGWEAVPEFQEPKDFAFPYPKLLGRIVFDGVLQFEHRVGGQDFDVVCRPIGLTGCHAILLSAKGQAESEMAGFSEEYK